MPYFVYQIENFPLRLLTRLAQFDSFKEASADAKVRRNTMTLSGGQIIKVMFAESELEAEDILSQVREKPPTTGEDF
jgi:hypothetical protein